jgi:opacity protein-like surface antigen
VSNRPSIQGSSLVFDLEASFMMIILALSAVVLICSAVPSAASDEGSVEISLAGSRLDLSGNALIDHSAGFVGGVSARVNGWLALVGEVGADFGDGQRTGFDQRRYTYSLLGGPRVSADVSRKFRVFGQLLVGRAQRVFTNHNLVVEGPASSPYSYSLGRFAWEPGAGVDFRVSPRWAVRLEGGVRVMATRSGIDLINGGQPPASGSSVTERRFTSGMVFRP